MPHPWNLSEEVAASRSSIYNIKIFISSTPINFAPFVGTNATEPDYPVILFSWISSALVAAYNRDKSTDKHVFRLVKNQSGIRKYSSPIKIRLQKLKRILVLICQVAEDA